MNASKINFSAVGRGDGGSTGGEIALLGSISTACSLNGSAYKSIPDERDPIQLRCLPAAERRGLS